MGRRAGANEPSKAGGANRLTIFFEISPNFSKNEHSHFKFAVNGKVKTRRRIESFRIHRGKILELLKFSYSFLSFFNIL